MGATITPPEEAATGGDGTCPYGGQPSRGAQCGVGVTQLNESWGGGKGAEAIWGHSPSPQNRAGAGRGWGAHPEPCPCSSHPHQPRAPQSPVMLPLDQSPPPLVTNSTPAFFFFPFPPFLLKSPLALGELGCFCIPQGCFPSGGAPCHHLPGSPGEGRGWPLDASLQAPS